MSNYGSERSDRSDVQLPAIVRNGSAGGQGGGQGGLGGCGWEDWAPNRRIGSPLIHERASATDEWINSQKDPPLYPRPPSADPHDQLRMFKEELAKRDRLISQLTSIETPRPRAFDSSRIEEFYSNDRMTAAANAKSEAAILQVKLEGIQSQHRDAQNQIDIREEKLRDMHLALETAKEADAKHVALVQSLREKLVEYEAQRSILEGNACRSELAIKTLKEDNEASKQRILDLESLLRSNISGQKDLSTNHQSSDQRLNNMIQQLSSLLPESDSSSLSPDQIVAMVKDLNREVIESRSKLSALKERLLSLEFDQKANRETIIRLAAEAQKEKDLSSHVSVGLESAKKESEASKNRVIELQNELKSVSGILENTQAALAGTRQELQDHQNKQGLLDHEAELKQKSLRSGLIPLLSSDEGELNDDIIRDKVENLIMTVKDKTRRIELLQGKLADVTRELHRSREEMFSNERSELGIRDHELRLRKTEDELAAGEVLRDELRADKEKFFKFLEMLSRTLSMDSVTIDVGLEGTTAAILARAEQVMKNGSSDLVDRKTQIYGLQRQIKTLKEQHDSKDLHMDLLRKKVVALEERLSGKSEVEREKDSEFVKNRKLVKLVEKYKCELNEAHVEIRDLKARLLCTSEIQNKSLQADRRIDELEGKIRELEGLRCQQTDKIASLKGLVKTNSSHTAKKDEIAGNTIQALTSELRTTKQAMEETTKREHQLLELRQVVSRMLGLDLNSLAVPDYELVARLEKLIVANQANAATALVLDSAIADLGEGFHAGYQDATRSLALATRSFNNPYRRPVGMRVASPQRRFENPAF